jgi:hypothetical protein
MEGTQKVLWKNNFEQKITGSSKLHACRFNRLWTVSPHLYTPDWCDRQFIK